MKVLTNQDTNDVDDTSPTYKALEEGSSSQTKEELVHMAMRQQSLSKDCRLPCCVLTTRRTASTASQAS